MYPEKINYPKHILLKPNSEGLKIWPNQYSTLKSQEILKFINYLIHFSLFLLFTSQLIVKNLFSQNFNFNVSIHYTQKKKSSQSKMTKVEYIFLHWDHRVNINFLKIDYFRPFHTHFPFTIEFFRTNFNTYTNKT